MKIHYFKTRPIDLPHLEEQASAKLDPSNPTYNPFQIGGLQQYNPIYSHFFEMTPSNFDLISLNHTYHFQDMGHVVSMPDGKVCEKEVFIKFSPLLDPVRYMIGKYDVGDGSIRSLPRLGAGASVHPKIADPNNASYVDCFFSYLTSSLLHKHGFVHGIDFYGSFLGIQRQFRACVTDDLDYLRESDFFLNNVYRGPATVEELESVVPIGGRMFYVVENQEKEEEYLGGSRRNRNRLCIETGDDDIVLDDVENVCDLGLDVTDETNADTTCKTVYDTATTDATTAATTAAASVSSSNNSQVNYSSSDESESESVSDSESESESDDKAWETDSELDTDSLDSCIDPDEIYGYIHNFPVQMICLEKCSGTLDELFVRRQVDAQLAASAFFQVIMSLIVYQKAFHFTHNDLHTNNIMYVETDVEFLWYRYSGAVYKVPTYGKIFKLIDFGRGIYKYAGRSFCSDSFGVGGDAVTQYNIEPFLNPKKPRLEPNYSFDLCRLGCSIYDFIIQDGDREETMDDFQRTIARWCTDDNGKNMLYKKSGEERYPNFKLYKMIARTVHAHFPEAQLAYPFFAQFLVDGATVATMDVDALPCYV
jgi:hypothetical protein